MLGLGLRVWIDGVSRNDRSGRGLRVLRFQVMNGKSASPLSVDRWAPIWRHAPPLSSGVVVEGERLTRLSIGNGLAERVGDLRRMDQRTPIRQPEGFEPGCDAVDSLAVSFGGVTWRSGLA
jgi:hypothetical protein